MGVGMLEAVQEEDSSPEDMRKSLLILKDKLRRQSRLVLKWKSKFNDETRLVSKLKEERHNYLQTIQTQLLVFESNLKKGKSELTSIVEQKDIVIRRQHQLVCSLTLALLKRDGQRDIQKILPGLKLSSSNNNNNHTSESEKLPHNNETVMKNNIKNCKDSLIREEDTRSPLISSKNDLESLNDSDSAIMMEDAYDSLIALPVGKGEAKVMRSVSDALEIISRGVSSSVNSKVSKGAHNDRRSSGHGSLSSSPSCSSEESDDSPHSTINKHRIDRLNEEYNEFNHHNICTPIPQTAPFSTSTPLDYHNNQTHRSNTDILWDISSSNSCKPGVTPEDSGLCHSPSCSSTSTTPVVSPSTSPSTSPLTQPKQYPTPPTETSMRDDVDSDSTLSDGGQSDEQEISYIGKRFIASSPPQVRIETETFYGSYERLHHVDGPAFRRKTQKDELIQVTYNRVMSNHRSVTKPKDVKYKRINKAKSRSLEELRGKLKFDGKQQSIITRIGQSDA